MKIQNYYNLSVPVSMVAISNFFKPYLSQTISQVKLKLDGRHRDDMEIQNSSVPLSKIVTMMAFLKLFKQHQILDCIR